MKKINSRKIISYSLMIVSILMILSGLGITQYKIMSKLTFGLLDKAQAFKLHTNLAIVFIGLIIAHIGFSIFRRRK